MVEDRRCEERGLEPTLARLWRRTRILCHRSEWLRRVEDSIAVGVVGVLGLGLGLTLDLFFFEGVLSLAIV